MHDRAEGEKGLVMSKIHSTAIISDGAEVGEEAEVGPYCVVGPNVKIGAGTKLMSHVVVDGNTTIGANCQLYPFASIGTQTQDLKFDGGQTFVEVGDDTTLREYVTVNSATVDGEVTRVGKGCNLLAYSHVAHACQVGDGVIMSNAVQLAGHVIVEDFAIIGGLSGVHQFVRIGTMCMVGGCTKIGQDLAPYLLADGNPARVPGLNSIGLKRRGVPPDACKTLKAAFKIVYREGLPVKDALAKVDDELDGGEELNRFIGFIRESERGILR